MRLLIENTFTAQTQIVDLVNRDYRIGRAEDCDIVLDSKFVSRHQAVIEFKRTFFIRSSGSSAIFHNDQPLNKDEAAALERGDTVKIGEYVLAVASDASQTALETQKLDLAKKFGDLEVAVHSELLIRLNLRGLGLTTAHLSDENVQLVHKHLSELLNLFPFPLESEVEDYVVREGLRTEMMDQIRFQGNKRGAQARPTWQEASREYDGETGALKSRLAQDMQLTDRAEDLVQNAEKVDKEFDDALAKRWLELSPGLKRHLLKRRISKDIHDTIFGLGPLQDLLDYPNITEIMVVSRSQIYVEKNGIIEDSGRSFVSDAVSMSIIERIVAPLGRRIDKASPLVDARLPNGSRVNAIIPPLAIKGPCITIRKFSPQPLTIDDLIEKGTLNLRAAKFLQAAVQGKKNVVISGGTGSGKTTLLNVLSAFILPHERIVTVEDSAELQLAHKHVVQLETKPANIEGSKAYTIRDLVRNALRMRPDRIIVGECRGGEALDMLQAMNTGHSGSMTTAHANSPEDMMLRLETMVVQAEPMPLTAVRSQIGSAIDLIVQQSRIGKVRRVTKITEVVGMDEREGRVIQEDIFVYRSASGLPADGELVFTGYMPTFMLELTSINPITGKNFLQLTEVF